jgi:hypothetical protein
MLNVSDVLIPNDPVTGLDNIGPSRNVCGFRFLEDLGFDAHFKVGHCRASWFGGDLTLRA